MMGRGFRVHSGRRFWVHQGEGSSSWATGIKANTSKSSASLLKITIRLAARSMYYVTLFTVKFTEGFTFYHCIMLHILQWDNCKCTVLPDILIVILQCAFPLHCKFTVGTCCEIDARAMAFTMGIQWFYSGHTVYLQCVHCKIIQCRELLTPLPL